MTIEHCPICEFGPLNETYANAKELRFSFDICPCCGCEYGYDDIESHYQKWAASGFKWFNPKIKPEAWSIGAQLKYQIRPWPPRSGKTSQLVQTVRFAHRDVQSPPFNQALGIKHEF